MSSTGGRNRKRHRRSKSTTQAKTQVPVKPEVATPAAEVPEALKASEAQVAHSFLDAAGVAKGENLAERIMWVAHRWLDSCAHSEGCQCRQCIASRRVLLFDHARQFL